MNHADILSTFLQSLVTLIEKLGVIKICFLSKDRKCYCTDTIWPISDHSECCCHETVPQKNMVIIQDIAPTENIGPNY